MSIPDPESDDQLKQSHHYLKILFDNLKRDHPTPEIFDTLSMGMTHDVELAVSEEVPWSGSERRSSEPELPRSNHEPSDWIYRRR